MDPINERRSARALLEANVHEPFIRLSNEMRELGCINQSINQSTLSTIPDPLIFYRDYVSANRPCLIEGVADDWPAMTKWKENQYLIDRMRDQSISVSCTPDGLADSINQSIDRFVMPCDEQWPFEKFLNECTAGHDVTNNQSNSQSNNQSTNPSNDQSNNRSINQSTNPPKAVIYAQHQNSSLTSEFSPLSSDIKSINWAINAFGCEPEAINLWIGNDQSISSPHFDHYENIYTVVSGVKRFLLWPPQDAYFMNRRRVKQARWVRNPAFKQLNEQSTDQSTEKSGDNSTNQADNQSINQSINQPEFIIQNDDDMPNIPWPDVDARKEWLVHASQEQMGDMFQPINQSDVDHTINQLTNQLNNQLINQSSTQSSTNKSANRSTNQSPPQLIPDRLRHQHAPPLCVTLSAGQTLYLPSLWFHAVMQGRDEQGKTIAVNSWFDMKYDNRFASFGFLNEQIDEAYQQLEDIDEQFKKQDDEEADE